MRWRERLQEGGDPVIEISGQRVLVGNPRVIWRELEKLEWGEHVSEQKLYRRLADRLNAGRVDTDSLRGHLRIVCEVSWEDLTKGASIDQVAPFWRMVELGSSLAHEVTFGNEELAILQSKEAEMYPVLARSATKVGIEWFTLEELKTEPLNMMLDIRIDLELLGWFVERDEYFEESNILSCFIFEHKPWWGVIRDLSCASDTPKELEFPMYDEFEGTEMSGFQFAEVIANRIGKSYRRLGPFEEPIHYEVWDFRELVA